MSDLSGLHGVYAPSFRWNAERGFPAVSVFNPELGERELQEIELGKPATFVLDLSTRERGYGLIKSGIYDMRLTPVGSPPPPWPDDDEYKPAIGCWLWNPPFGELRLETNATIFREAIADVWDRCRFEPKAAEGQQPVICFADRVARTTKSVNKTFYAPVIEIIGWIPRNQIWREREPTVPPPSPMPILPAATTAPPTALDKKLEQLGKRYDVDPAVVERARKKGKNAPKGPAVDLGLDDSIDDIFRE
jgi:hypothetical protein